MHDADAMVNKVEQTGVKCMVEFFNRWSPPFTYAKRAVDNGEVGDVIAFSIELNDTIWVPTEMLKCFPSKQFGHISLFLKRQYNLIAA
jgi:predicted dehydrogenase